MPRFLTVLMLTALMVGGGASSPALADHTDPSEPQSDTTTNTVLDAEAYAAGEGTWEHLRNFAPNPGTDLKFFKRRGEVYSSSGTLGQADTAHVGQRIVKLADRRGNLDVEWVADHGSAACTTANPTGTTGLQHDAAVTPANDAEILIDTTDATGRCHDSPGGGLELVDLSGLGGKKPFVPREIHLTRHAGTSHTVTVDDTRPWVVYNSSSDFSGRPWIDVLDIRSCLGLGDKSLAQKRAACRPNVYRIPFEDSWSQQRDPDGTLRPNSSAACHDITVRGTRLYCAALNATLIFDVAGLTDPTTNAVRGTPLACTVRDGTRTGAQVTDCSAANDRSTTAEGWAFLGTYNHPGRNDGAGGTTGNTNVLVPSDEGVAVAHEADPTPDHQHMFVTDERGGGVVPGGATCAPGIDNPYGNGGIHVFDISDPAAIEYAQTPAGDKAVWISDQLIAAPTFCTVHVIEQVPDEQRLIVAYYSQGTKIVDYFIDDQGRWTFKEVASLTLPGAQTWATEDFAIRNNKDGTRTYFLTASDIGRGIDVLTWTGKPNPMGAQAPASADTSLGADLTLAVGLAALPLIARLRRRRLDATPSL